MILVMAGKYNQYREWLTNHPEIQPKQTKYVQFEKDLIGWDYQTTSITYIGEYWLNPLCDHQRLELFDEI